MDRRRLQAPTRLLPFQAQGEIEAIAGARLNPSERPAPGDERNVGLARLDGHLAETSGCGDNGLKNGTQLRAAGVHVCQLRMVTMETST